VLGSAAIIGALSVQKRLVEAPPPTVYRAVMIQR
jgi:hypothetical protein